MSGLLEWNDGIICPRCSKPLVRSHILAVDLIQMREGMCHPCFKDREEFHRRIEGWR